MLPPHVHRLSLSENRFLTATYINELDVLSTVHHSIELIN